MRKNKLFLILAGFISVIAGGYFGYVKLYLPRKFARLTVTLVEKAAAGLDSEALAGQAIHIAIPGTQLNEQNRKIITELKPGGIIFFGFNLEGAAQIKKFTTDLQQLATELGLPPFLISTDQEGGYVKRVPEGVLKTPPAMDLGNTGDSELCKSTGYHVSRDLGNLGINVFFAPIVDINNNPQNPVIGLRSFGAMLPAVLGCALPFEQGARIAYKKGGAMPVIKHFPGHGDTQVDSHWALPVIDKKLEELKVFELVPFRTAIASGAPAVMTAHILYPQVDKEVPATLSTKWLTGVLRQDLGFAGLVFTDAMEMSAVATHFSQINRPVAALTAGADVLLYTSWQEDPVEAKKLLVTELRDGSFKNQGSPLHRAALNQLRAKLPHLKPEKYLTTEEAAWYIRYRDEKLAGDAMAIRHTPAMLTEKFSTIKWSTKRKRNQPQWLAGRKNK